MIPVRMQRIRTGPTLGRRRKNPARRGEGKATPTMSGRACLSNLTVSGTGSSNTLSDGEERPHRQIRKWWVSRRHPIPTRTPPRGKVLRPSAAPCPLLASLRDDQPPDISHGYGHLILGPGPPRKGPLLRVAGKEPSRFSQPEPERSPERCRKGVAFAPDQHPQELNDRDRI
jgi:hypothetical protein